MARSAERAEPWPPGFGLRRSRSYPGRPILLAPKHRPHCGVTIATCAGGDLRASVDGVTIYAHDGVVERPVPAGRAFPDKEAVIDELYDAVRADREPLHNGRWGKATMEATLAVLSSAQTRQEVVLKHQVPVND
jgi:phthalate 4,5-cis-dihydrodiol dehydrogenase